MKIIIHDYILLYYYSFNNYCIVLSTIKKLKINNININKLFMDLNFFEFFMRKALMTTKQITLSIQMVFFCSQCLFLSAMYHS